MSSHQGCGSGAREAAWALRGTALRFTASTTIEAMTYPQNRVLEARALVLHDMEATGITGPESVSVLEEAVSSRRWWVERWEEGAAYVAGLVAQDVQDNLMETNGRWPLCPVCPSATHALYIHPEIGGPDPHWVCEATGTAVAPLGGLSVS